MSSTQKNEEIVINKVELKPFTFTVTEINPRRNWNQTLHVTINDLNNIINDVKFYFQESTSGCGLATIQGVTAVYSFYPKEPEDDIIKQKAEAYGKAINQFALTSNAKYSTDKKGCVLCTLGHNYKKFEKFVLWAGFVEIHSFHNLAHGSLEMQTIYALDIK